MIIKVNKYIIRYVNACINVIRHWIKVNETIDNLTMPSTQLYWVYYATQNIEQVVVKIVVDVYIVNLCTLTLLAVSLAALTFSSGTVFSLACWKRAMQVIFGI